MQMQASESNGPSIEHPNIKLNCKEPKRTKANNQNQKSYFELKERHIFNSITI